MAYIGDGNNMVHSLMIGAAKIGMDILYFLVQNGYKPNEEIVAIAAEGLLKKAVRTLSLQKIR